MREQKRPAILVVCTNTFYAPAVALLAARKRGVPVIHWVFDLYPDVLVQLQRVRAGGMVDRFLSHFTSYALRHSVVNVFLGEDVKRRAEERFGILRNSALIPVGADGAPFRSNEPRFEKHDPIRVLYCGNVGRMHDVDTIIQLIRDGIPEPFVFQFRGKGVGMEKLEKSISNCNGVTLGSSLAQEDWIHAMRETEIALVTFKDDAHGLGMPSKTYSAMVAGQAILAICPWDCDLGRTVREHDAGWVVEPGSVAKLNELLKHIAENPDELLAKRSNAYRAGHEVYDQMVIAAQWDDLFKDLATAAATEETPSKGYVAEVTTIATVGPSQKSPVDGRSV
jgi:glycosyltransferase involved in cell wall biosynthesis